MMPDALAIYEKIKAFPSWVLAIICIVILIAYIIHIKILGKSLSTVTSDFEIIKSMKTENGQITLYPKNVIKINTANYKYSYECTLQINTIKNFSDGFNMTIASSTDFIIKLNQNVDKKSAHQKPKHSLFLNSDVFKKSPFASERMFTLDFFIHSNQKQLDLDITVNFGSGSITSKVFLNP